MTGVDALAATPRAAGDPAPAPLLVVTTAHRATLAMIDRADEVARRCRTQVVARRGVATMLASADLIYVVGRDEEYVFSAEGRLVAGEGLMKLKRVDGDRHPLVRAVAPAGTATATVFDATLGGGQDALHLSVVAGLTVDGIEVSPALVCLVENFLARAVGRWGDAARRIRVREGDAGAHLRALAPASYDVVYLDPMFDKALPSQPDFRVMRRLAHHAPLTDALLAEAVRVARQRVVVKVRTLGNPGVTPPAPGWNRRVGARAFDYWVCEKALADPTIDPLRVKYSTQRLRSLGLLGFKK